VPQAAPDCKSGSISWASWAFRGNPSGTGLLHNQTSFALQRKLLFDGFEAVILPIRMRFYAAEASDNFCTHSTIHPLLLSPSRGQASIGRGTQRCFRQTKANRANPSRSLEGGAKSPSPTANPAAYRNGDRPKRMLFGLFYMVEKNKNADLGKAKDLWILSLP